ncbi:hypothetical protein BEP19_08025 [Ammoniphilus oxalaticus]|uniref:VWFA domain-containing protein n=1 Tax=Ammoniphilus oxalaticus TaxID=66863 RepID=A0A419SJX5_9BACL|nr:VWA domain-containing protein [Ammoniphilus oxalaticus]RKD24334.1 hypothetical protein BEP19_08025 [Ammoniphilus oxalaticus]
MKYIVLDDKKVDTALFLQLQDLACVLSRTEDLKFKFDFGHYVDLRHRVITASRFWDRLPQQQMEAGLKTDLYLRAIGTIQHTDYASFQTMHRFLAQTHLRRFGAALFTLLEDLRLEEHCKRDRPGTAKLFQARRDEYYRYFESQLAVNQNRGFGLDALFCLIYLTLYSAMPMLSRQAQSEQAIQLEWISPYLYESFDTQHTRDVTLLVEKIISYLLPYYERDCVNEYFVAPFSGFDVTDPGVTIDDLKRKRSLENEDLLDRPSRGEEAEREKMPMWHREQKADQQNQSFLSFEMESGTKIPLLGGSARETETGDQVLASVQGKASAASGNEDTEQQLQQELDSQGNSKREPYGRENRDVALFFKVARKPTEAEQTAYQEMSREVERHIRSLAKTVEKTIEHKRTDPLGELMLGRLSKRLLPLVFEPIPRVFYKKRNESRTVDATFTLLVDCSASMHNKMTDTKKGITMFHEVLKKLRIPHAIIGFWEDGSGVKKGYQPNYFHMIQQFEQSIYVQSGAEIMQLEPQEDNRDGLSVRVAARQLQKRQEKHRFLLVFSDGEPAADGYHQNGIVDTKEAVLEARKQGIEVIGLFLSDGIVSEVDQKTMRNIYDKEHLVIPAIEQLPQQFAALLKRLLLKSI